MKATVLEGKVLYASVDVHMFKICKTDTLNYAMANALIRLAGIKLIHQMILFSGSHQRFVHSATNHGTPKDDVGVVGVGIGNVVVSTCGCNAKGAGPSGPARVDGDVGEIVAGIHANLPDQIKSA